MDRLKIISKLKKRFPHDLERESRETQDPYVVVEPDALREVVEYVQTDPDLSMDLLHSLAGVDYGPEDKIGITYHFTSFEHRHWLTLKVEFEDRADCRVDSIADLYATADWHEREAFDLMGVVFTGHPDLRPRDSGATHTHARHGPPIVRGIERGCTGNGSLPGSSGYRRGEAAQLPRAPRHRAGQPSSPRPVCAT